MSKEHIIRANLEASRALLENLDRDTVVSLSLLGEVSTFQQDGAAEVLASDLLREIESGFRNRFKALNTYVSFLFGGIEFDNEFVSGGSFIPPESSRYLTDAEIRDIREKVEIAKRASKVTLSYIYGRGGDSSVMMGFRLFYLTDGRISVRPVGWAEGLDAEEFLKKIEE